MNQAIIDAGGAVVGDERSFWLGMKENTSAWNDGSAVESSAITAYDQVQIEYLKELTTVRNIEHKFPPIIDNITVRINHIFKRILTASKLVTTVGIMVMVSANHNHQTLSTDETSTLPVKPKIVSVNWVQMDGMTLCVHEHGQELRNEIFQWAMFVKRDHSIHQWFTLGNSKKLSTHGQDLS